MRLGQVGERAGEKDKKMTIINRTAYAFEDLQLGMEATVARTVSEADIQAFAEVTGDKNPVHLDEAYAAKTMFKGRIAHGMLSAGYISAVFGMELPGPGAIYVSQTLNFKAPVRIGDHVIAKVTVAELMDKRRARFDCVCLGATKAWAQRAMWGGWFRSNGAHEVSHHIRDVTNFFDSIRYFVDVALPRGIEPLFST